jgi:hypothetical protein
MKKRIEDVVIFVVILLMVVLPVAVIIGLVTILDNILLRLGG